MSRLMAENRGRNSRGNHFPAVAVRDLAIQPRENDLVLATHGRGIWIVDDITPLRALRPELIAQKVAFIQRDLYNSGLKENGEDGPMGTQPLSAIIRRTLPS